MFPGKDNKLLRILKLERITDTEVDDNFYDVVDIEMITTVNLDSEIINGILENEIENKITNTLYNYLLSDLEATLIDVNLIENQIRNSAIEIPSVYSNIVDETFKSLRQYKNMNFISNGNIMSSFQDLVDYTVTPHLDSSTKVTTFYSMGKFSDNDLYVNALLRWDDNKILIFDKKLFYTYSNYKIEPYPTPDILMRHKITCKLYIDKSILKNRALYLIKDNNGALL